MAEMAQQVAMDVDFDLEAGLQALFDNDHSIGNDMQPDEAEIAQKEQEDLPADLDIDIDDASLFGDDESQHPGSPKLGDAARQDSVQPAASQAQGIMTEEGSQSTTGLALPRLGLPMLRTPKPAPPVVAEQPTVVEPVVTGRLAKKQAAQKRKGKGKGKEKAYSGARVPEQLAGQATVRPATAPYELGIPRDEDLFATPDDAFYDRMLGALDGDIEQQVAAAAIAAQPAEIDFAGALDSTIDLTMAEPAFPAQQQAPLAPVAHQGAGIAQAVPPPPPVPQLPLFSGPDDVDLDVAAGKWGRWHPKSMSGKQYIVQDRRPYDDNNPRDLYDYLQAVIAAIHRQWPGKWFEKRQGRGRPAMMQERYPTDPALFWCQMAWTRLCDSYIAQEEEKCLLLPAWLQGRLLQCGRWIQDKHLNGDATPEQTVETVMLALIEFAKMPWGILQQGVSQQQGDSQQQAIVIE